MEKLQAPFLSDSPHHKLTTLPFTWLHLNNMLEDSSQENWDDIFRNKVDHKVNLYNNLAVIINRRAFSN